MSIPPIDRTVTFGMSGRDVAGFKRELHFAGERVPGFVWLNNATVGNPMVNAIIDFQQKHGIAADGEIGPITHEHLWRYGDAYAHWLIANYRAPQRVGPRTRFHNVLVKLVEKHWAIDYSQDRPIPLRAILNLYRGVDDPRPRSDCSGLLTGAAYAAGLPDPNGLHYDGEGFTGTMLSHLTSITPNQARLGDLVIFGSYPGKHVVALADMSKPDPIVFSHGHRGDNPDDPHFYNLSGFLNYFSGYAVTYKSLL